MEEVIELARKLGVHYLIYHTSPTPDIASAP